MIMKQKKKKKKSRFLIYCYLCCGLLIIINSVMQSTHFVVHQQLLLDLTNNNYKKNDAARRKAFIISGRSGFSGVHVHHQSSVSSSSLLKKATTVKAEADNNKGSNVSSSYFASFDLSRSPPWAVFYNAHVPNDSAENRDGALQIIEEQLQQISESYAANSHYYPNTTLPVFYNSIGTPINDTVIRRSCSRAGENNNNTAKLNCVHMDHYEEGTAFEEVTLHRLQQYCQSYPNNRAIYVHSKGSHHSRDGQNTYWRRHMTIAVTHQDCVNPPDQSCDICGLVFSPQPFIHFSGNFFTAQCSYINKLLPMFDFQTKMNHELLHLTKQYQNQSKLLFQTSPYNEAYMGVGRYASEAWPASHPSVVPCDLSHKMLRGIRSWKKPREPEDIERHLRFSLAPRPRMKSGMELFQGKHRDNVSRRMREYYLLPGHMFKWMKLYNEVPSNSSWVWDYYPDGNVWRDKYHQHGMNTFESVVDSLPLR